MWYDAARKVVWLGLCFRFLRSENFNIAFCRSVWLLFFFFFTVHSTFCLHTNPHRCMCMFSWRHLQFIIPWRAHMTWMNLNWQPFSPPVPEVHAGRLAILLTLPLADVLQGQSSLTKLLYIDKSFSLNCTFIRDHMILRSVLFKSCRIGRNASLSVILYLNFLLIYVCDFIAKRVFLSTINKVLVLNINIFPLDQRDVHYTS